MSCVPSLLAVFRRRSREIRGGSPSPSRILVSDRRVDGIMRLSPPAVPRARRSVARDRRRARVAPEERAVHHPASRQLGGEAVELVDSTNSDVHDAHAHAPLIAARLQPERLELRGLQLGFDRLHGERGAIAAGVPSHAGLENQETRGASAAGCGAAARTGGRDTLRGTAMPRRGRPAQGHAPAEGLAQYDMAPLFVADAERRTQALGATRTMVECWLIP